MSTKKQNIAGHFDAEAVRYDRAYDAPGTIGRGLRRRQLAALNLLGDGPGRLLDAGLGPGRLCEEARRRHWSVVGVDISDQMVALARERLGDVDASLLLASVEQLPFAERTFDAVVALGVFGHVPGIDAFLDEVHRLLRTNGRLIVSVQNVGSIRFQWFSAIWYPAMRLVKKRIRTSRPAPLRASGPVKLSDLNDMLAQRGLAVGAVSYVGFGFVTPRASAEPGPPDSERQMPGQVGGRCGPLRKLLATAIVVSAVRRSPDDLAGATSGFEGEGFPEPS